MAVPDRMDPSWKVSSEKVPHMTILFLGDTVAPDDQLHVVQHVQHCVDMSLSRFGMSVDRRGELGPNKADVLFFELPVYNKELVNFRHNILMDDKVKTLYDSVEQYPEWTPHLTLGYPDSPARELESEFGLNWVRFDKIEVWVGDSSGPSFPLKEESMAEVMAQAAVEAGENFLAHYGVKGMKWGKRKDRSVTVGTKPGSSSLKVSGGSGRPASADAKKAAVANQIARKSGVNALTNSQLDAAVKRLQLEKKYREVKPSAGLLGKGKKFLASFNQSGKLALESLNTGFALQSIALKAKSTR